MTTVQADPAVTGRTAGHGVNEVGYVRGPDARAGTPAGLHQHHR